MPEKLDPVWTFLSTFTISSFAGLAALLRSGKPISVRAVVSAMLNSGLIGLGIALAWYNHAGNNVWFVMGVSLLAGLGGVTVIDFFIALAKRGGVNITISPKATEILEETRKKEEENEKDITG